MRRFARIALFLTLLSLSSCGYHFGAGSAIDRHRTISVPYVEGDWDGSLTAAIIKQIGESSQFSYRSCGGSLILKVAVIEYYDDNIGFQYDQKKSGKPRHILIPNETRTTVVVEVNLIESTTGKLLLGPVNLFAEIEYDHDYYSNRNAINVFSLGQLTDVEEAYDAAQDPLNRRLAEKIVDYVTNNW